MVTLERFIYPESLEEALAALAAGRDKARAIAGGTSLVFFKGRGMETLVDITRLGMADIGIDDGGDLVLGACARLQTIGNASDATAPAWVALAEAARTAGPMAVRNAVTLGGNVAGYKRWSDPPIALMALGATVEIAIAGADSRTVTVTELMQKHPLTSLDAGELITRLRLPKRGAATGSAFVKFARTAIDYALLSAAAQVTLDEAGRCVAASLALGAVRQLPVDASEIAGALVGEAPTDEALDRLAGRVQQEVDPGEDMRASKEYLAEVSGVIARDAVARAVARARGEH